MLVLSMTAVPPGLRGELTRWLLEISPGVFVGNISARVREHIWELVRSNRRLGSATMVYRAANEQRLKFKTCGSPWSIVDLDGLQLVRRQEMTAQDESALGVPGVRSAVKGWSKVSKRRKLAKR